MDPVRYNAIFARVREARRTLIDVDAALDSASVESLNATQAGHLVQELSTLLGIARNLQTRAQRQQARRTNPPITARR
jgi:hypothetical protein